MTPNPHRKRGNPYGRKRVEKAGLSFDSKAESKLHDELLMLEKAGEIKILKLQDRVHIVAGIHTIADFRVQDCRSGEEYWVECKGFETPEWRLKRRLWLGHCHHCGQAFGPGKLKVHYGRKTEVLDPSPAMPEGV